MKFSRFRCSQTITDYTLGQKVNGQGYCRMKYGRRQRHDHRWLLVKFYLVFKILLSTRLWPLKGLRIA